MQNKLLKLLTENARMGLDELSLRSGMQPADVENAIREMEKSGVICGYTAI